MDGTTMNGAGQVSNRPARKKSKSRDLSFLSPFASVTLLQRREVLALLNPRTIVRASTSTDRT
jgi:hypothetical protein